jgi:hypothetical protein
MTKVKNLKLYLSFSKKLCDESIWDSGGIDPHFPNLGTNRCSRLCRFYCQGESFPVAIEY